jgi:hypothetical protein
MIARIYMSKTRRELHVCAQDVKAGINLDEPLEGLIWSSEKQCKSGVDPSRHHETSG